jgi:Uncharacterized low-complexity proteins
MREDLSGEDMIGGHLLRTNLNRAELSGAGLRGADLSGTDLSGASVMGTDLRDTNLTDADLTGVKLGVALRDPLYSNLCRRSHVKKVHLYTVPSGPVGLYHLGGDGGVTRSIQVRFDTLEVLPAAQAHYDPRVHTALDEQVVRPVPPEVVAGDIKKPLGTGRLGRRAGEKCARGTAEVAPKG